MASADSYYYDHLSKEGKKAYYAIREALENLAPSATVPRLSGRELADIYFQVRMDHPGIFWSVKFSWRYYPDSENAELIPEYLFPKAKIREHQTAMASRVKKLARGAAGLKTDLEKELYIHDFLVQNVRYDKLKKPYSHEIIGSLGNGVAVCEGIAKAVKILCDELGIWCIVVLSENNPEKGIKYRHAWNLVKIDGHCYHLDVTFDNSLTGWKAGQEALPEQGVPQALSQPVMRYDYVNLSDRQVFRDHEPSIWPIPAAADEKHTWFQEKKLAFTRIEEIAKRSQQAIRRKKPLLFQWRGGYLTRNMLEELLTVIRSEAEAKDHYPLVSLNWPQSVLLVRFLPTGEAGNPELLPEGPAAEGNSVKMEDANEGELYDGE